MIILFVSCDLKASSNTLPVLLRVYEPNQDTAWSPFISHTHHYVGAENSLTFFRTELNTVLVSKVGFTRIESFKSTSVGLALLWGSFNAPRVKLETLAFFFPDSSKTLRSVEMK